MKNLWICLRLFLLLTFVTGIAYPLLIWGFGQLVMNQKANGDFVISQDKKIGALLIAQNFASDSYFWGRPSFIDYNPIPSGGSNLGPTSAALKKAVEERKARLLKAHGDSESAKLPSELLFASGSGLDPHISLNTALFQVDRVLKARQSHPGINKQNLLKLITELTEPRRFGFIGEPMVNVLKLNIALNNLYTPI